MTAAAMKKALWLTLGLSLWLVAGTLALACPMCQEALSSQNDPAFGIQLTQGYARSIALMMATPYVVFAGVTLLIVRHARRTKR